VNAKPYFQARLCSADGTESIQFEEWFGVVWNTASVLSLGCIILSQVCRDKVNGRGQEGGPDISSSLAEVVNDTGSQEPLNPNNATCAGHGEGHSFLLVVVPLSLYLVVFLCMDVLVFVPSIPPGMFLVLTLTGLSVCGMCSAIATAGVVSTAGLFPSHVGINPYFSGQALGGVAVSVANFIAATVEEPDDFWNSHCSGKKDNQDEPGRFLLEGGDGGAGLTCSPYTEIDWVVFAYFLLGCCVLAVCLVGYSFINKYQRLEHRNAYESVQDISEDHGLTGTPRIGLELHDRLHERQQANGLDEVLQQPASSPSSYRDDPLSEAASPDPSSNTIPSEIVPADEAPQISVEGGNITSAVWKAVKGPACTIYLTFAVTLCLFPGWISQLRSSHECETHWRLNNDLYTPMSFLVFNVGDLTGRLLSGRIPVTRIRNMSFKLVLVALIRIVFFPLFFLCVAGEGVTSHERMDFRSDLYSLLVQFFFAVSNGILISTSFMFAASRVGSTTDMQERSSEILTFSIAFGLLSGSLLSFPFTHAATGWR
jgi:hypothetical protein